MPHALAVICKDMKPINPFDIMAVAAFLIFIWSKIYPIHNAVIQHIALRKPVVVKRYGTTITH